MFELLKNNLQIVSTLISLLAFIVSFIALYENRKRHTDSHRAKIVFNIIQQNQKLYLFVQNIGQTTAFDVKIDISNGIKNPIQNLHVIPPNILYRYTLLDSLQISVYPDLKILEISIQYKDIYCKNSFWYEKNKFPILELLKYTCTWNEKQHCFDINRI